MQPIVDSVYMQYETHAKQPSHISFVKEKILTKKACQPTEETAVRKKTECNIFVL